MGQGSKQDFQANARPIAGNIVLVDLISHGMAINDGEPPIFVYDPNHPLAGDLYSESFPVDNQPGSMALARQLGAIGYVGILTYRAKDTCQEYHGPKVGTEVISGLTVSPSSGARIKELLAGGPVEATMVLTENPEPRLGSTPTFGKWGLRIIFTVSSRAPPRKCSWC